MILIKNQERSKGNKEEIRIRKSKYIESDRTHCCIGKFNVAFNLCRVLGVTFYFSEDFSEAAARGSAVAKALQPLGITVVCFLR